MEIDEASLDKMDLDGLKKLATTLNEKRKAGIDLDSKSARVMRERIKTFLAKNADEIVSDSKLTASGGSKEAPKKQGADKTGDAEEETEEEEEEEEAEEVTSPFSVGQEVEVNYGEEGWKRGKVAAVYIEADEETDSDAQSCDVEIGDEIVGAGWAEIRAYVPKTKTKVKATKLPYRNSTG